MSIVREANDAKNAAGGLGGAVSPLSGAGAEPRKK